MAERAAEIVWLCLGAYAAAGALIALILLFGGLRRIDPDAAAAPARVKLILLPGLIALWPLMLMRLFGVMPREDRP